eukprot:s1_g592.t1
MDRPHWVRSAGSLGMSFVQAYSRLRGVSVVIPSDIVRYVYLATAGVVLLGVLREVFVFQIGTDTVLQDLRHFALDAERNLGAWYSSALMVLIAACAMVNWHKDRVRDGLVSYSWVFIAVVFFCLSIDETVGFHETVDVPLRNHFELTGIFYNPWVFFGAAFVAGFVALLVPFLLDLPRHIAILFVVSGAIYVGGALGMEPLDAFFEHGYGEGHLYQVIATSIEEAMEMLGLTLFLHGNFIFMAEARTNVLVRRSA